MLVKLKINRVAHINTIPVPQKSGSVIEVSEDEAERMVAANQAELVDQPAAKKAEKAEPAVDELAVETTPVKSPVTRKKTTKPAA